MKRKNLYDYFYGTGKNQKPLTKADTEKKNLFVDFWKLYFRKFFKFMTVKRGYLEENPAANIEAPKRKKTLPKFLLTFLLKCQVLLL